jgi:protein TonB
MLRLFILWLTVFLFSTSVFGQTYTDSIDMITYIGSPPCYLGGTDSLKAFIKKNVECPVSAIKDGIEGKVYISFWVDVDGKTIKHEIVRGVRDDIDQEALRVSRLICFSTPAKQYDKPIKVRYTIVIVFNCQ